MQMLDVFIRQTMDFCRKVVPGIHGQWLENLLDSDLSGWKSKIKLCSIGTGQLFSKFREPRSAFSKIEVMLNYTGTIVCLVQVILPHSALSLTVERACPLSGCREEPPRHPYLHVHIS